ncbi:capsular polysaccharide biosynthesis protein [Bacillus sp. SORGH_AS 510]|uniref:YveK family protein n=1 Tax=Bacillus sp. SORGH_AS_0510 TaxID=3041771 RepID=UPI00277EB778|nr:Wzz/FepE/Etk N-terminal domain-containing protein [Bacillus sp. SORGH_AS_0510]MDQ1144585.1 capsular polysaccharide biosynthesis protein [Bacillus sp. SORGH_AS_0510]
MDKTIRLTDMFKTLQKRWKLIVLVTLAATTLSGVISYFVLTPVYQASTQILVNQRNAQDQMDTSLLQSNVDLINTYSVIVKSPVILDKVIEKLKLSQSVEQLTKNITVTSQENSQVFSLTIEDSDPVMAALIANTVSKTFLVEVQKLMKVDNVSIIAKASPKKDPVPVKPKPLLNITIAVVIGLLLGVGIAILVDYLDNTLKDDQDVIELLGMPVLGSIPKMSKSENKGNMSSINKEMGSETVAS